jgi:hypothetical protein
MADHNHRNTQAAEQPSLDDQHRDFDLSISAEAGPGISVQ